MALKNEVLEEIDQLVAEILAPRFERMSCIRTRSHAMLTCYPGSCEEVLDAKGQVWSGPCTAAKGYLRHLDNEREKGHCGRILTTILYLNPGWQDSIHGPFHLISIYFYKVYSYFHWVSSFHRTATREPCGSSSSSRPCRCTPRSCPCRTASWPSGPMKCPTRCCRRGATASRAPSGTSTGTWAPPPWASRARRP